MGRSLCNPRSSRPFVVFSLVSKKDNIPPSFELLQDGDSLVYQGSDGVRIGIGSKLRAR